MKRENFLKQWTKQESKRGHVLTAMFNVNPDFKFISTTCTCTYSKDNQTLSENKKVDDKN